MQKISLIIPVSDKHIFFLLDLLSDIHSFEYKPYEIILSISNGKNISKNILDDIRKYSEVLNLSIILNDENNSSGVNRNIGVNYSSGDILCFFDADDKMHPQYFQIINECFENNDIVHLNHCCTTYISTIETKINNYNKIESNSIYNVYFPKNEFYECELITKQYGIPFTNNLTTGHVSVKKEIFETIKFSNNSTFVAEDYEFCMKCLFYFNKSMIITANLSIYRPQFSTYKTN